MAEEGERCLGEFNLDITCTEKSEEKRMLQLVPKCLVL